MSTEFQSTPEHRELLSVYREGMNATNPFYQLLCYYKVTERVWDLRGNRAKEAKAQGLPYTEIAERIPDDITVIDVDNEEFRSLFQSYRGWKFTRVRDNLANIRRRAIAHLLPEVNSLIADRLSDVKACRQAVPITKYMANTMIANEMAYLTSGRRR